MHKINKKYFQSQKWDWAGHVSRWDPQWWPKNATGRMAISSTDMAARPGRVSQRLPCLLRIMEKTFT